MHFITRLVLLLSLSCISTLSSAYQCTHFNAKVMTQREWELLALDIIYSAATEINLALAGSQAAVALTSWAKHKRSDANPGAGRKIRHRSPAAAGAPSVSKDSMTCSGSEKCIISLGVVSCWNDATYTLRDPWGATLNFFSGDYKLPDGTKGNVLTSPGPLRNYNPESEAYNDGDTDGYVSGGGMSSAAAARGTAVLTAAGTRGTGTASSNTGSGVVSGSLNDEDTESGTAIMRMWQGGWPLVGIVGGIALIRWM